MKTANILFGTVAIIALIVLIATMFMGNEFFTIHLCSLVLTAVSIPLWVYTANKLDAMQVN